MYTARKKRPRGDLKSRSKRGGEAAFIAVGFVGFFLWSCGKQKQRGLEYKERKSKELILEHPNEG